METIYKDTVGKTISLVIEDDKGEAIDLSSSTVSLKLYSIGDNTLKWTQTCDVDDASNGLAHWTNIATDFDTVGMYYSLVYIAYTGGNITTVIGPSFEVVEKEENIVTIKEFLEFVDIPEENAKSDTTIKTYLEMAEVSVNKDVPSLKNTTDSDYIKLKKNLIKIKGAILYWLNSDEGNINPDARNSKIKLWKEVYQQELDNFNSVLSSTSTGDGVIRRIKSKDYDDPTSYLYED